MQSTYTTKLPYDCWAKVVDWLPHQDIASTSLTSRDMHSLTEAFLYRRISWDWKTPPASSLLCLLRTLHQRPDLASYIEHVSLVSSFVENLGNLWRPPKIKEDDNWWPKAAPDFQDVVDCAIGIVKKAGFESPEMWIKSLRDGNVYVYVAILLSQLHNLRTVQLDYSFVWQGGFPGLMMRHALFSPNDSLSRFTRLEAVDYGRNVPQSELEEYIEQSLFRDRGYPLCEEKQFMAWFYLPSLKSLEIWLGSVEGMDIIGDNEKEKKKKKKKIGNLANMHTLVLVRSTVGYKAIRYLLSQTDSLKSLHLGMSFNQHMDFPVLKGGEALLQGLERVSGTLERLSIGMDMYPDCVNMFGWDEGDDYHPPFHGFLKKFPHLRSAEVPFTLLVGWRQDSWVDIADVVPAQLQQLALREDFYLVLDSDMDEKVILEHLQRFLRRCRSATPLLKHLVVRIWDQEQEFEWYLNERATAQRMYEKQGIVLDVLGDRMPPGLWMGMDGQGSP